MKYILKLVALICLIAALLTLGACKSEPVISGNARIFAMCVGFTLENAKGEIYHGILEGERTMPVHDELYGPGDIVDVSFSTNASEYFIYRDDNAEETYLAIHTEAYDYSIHCDKGEGEIIVKIGIDGLRIKSAPGEYRLYIKLNELGRQVDIFCTGEEITLKQEGAKVYISGVGDTLTLDYHDSKHRDAQTVTISGGSATIDYSLVEKSNKILVTDATGEEKGYYMTCIHG